MCSEKPVIARYAGFCYLIFINFPNFLIYYPLSALTIRCIEHKGLYPQTILHSKLF